MKKICCLEFVEAKLLYTFFLTMVMCCLRVHSVSLDLCINGFVDKCL